MRRLRLNETQCGAPLKSFGALRRHKQFSLITEHGSNWVTGDGLQVVFSFQYQAGAAAVAAAEQVIVEQVSPD